MARLFSNAHCLRPFLVVALLLLMSPALASAQTTTFTYQGRLQDTGTPANGSYDLQLTLWDAASGGTQQPQPSPVTVTRTSVLVTGGIFTVQLDFGASAFPGADRFLEIGVRPAGGGAFTILSPRQQTTSTPYAIRSANATTADSATTATTATTANNATQLGGVAASQYVVTSDSRLTDSRAPTAGSPNYIQNNPSSPQTGSNFNILGNGTASGTLSSNIINATTQYNLGGNRVLSIGIQGQVNTFAGVSAGQANTISGSLNTFFGNSAGQRNTDGSRNAFFGSLAGQANTLGASNSFFGANAGSSNTADFNSFFGSLAGQANTLGASNSFFGANAGSSNTSNFNSFFGSEAGFNHSTGDNNAFFGTNAGASATTGSSNTVIGANANVVDGLFNATAIGANALAQRSNSVVLGFADDVFVGFSGSALDTASGDNLYIANTGGNSNNSFRLDGFQNNLFIVARSGTGSAAGAGIVFRTAAAAGGEFDRVGIDANGNVAINVLGSAGSSTLCRNSSNQIATCSSSLRYKKDVARFAGGLDIINRLRPIAFTWKQGGMRDVGLAAEEVEKVEPLLTFRNDKGEIEGVKYNQLSAVFVNAFKEQQAQIQQQQVAAKQQQDQIAALRTANATLNARLRSVERIVRKKVSSARRRH